MEVEKDGWMSINLFCRDWLISFMRTTSVVLPWRNFDLNVLLKKQTASLCVNCLLGSKLCQCTALTKKQCDLDGCNKFPYNTKPLLFQKSGLSTFKVSLSVDFSIRDHTVKRSQLLGELSVQSVKKSPCSGEV